MKKKVVAALLTTAMVLSMGACGTKDGGNTTDGGNEGGGESKGYEFEILVKSFQSTYWQAAVQGIEQACGELGKSVDLTDQLTNQISLTRFR